LPVPYSQPRVLRRDVGRRSVTTLRGSGADSPMTTRFLERWQDGEDVGERGVGWA
jgi:hypothetical protein